MLRSVHPGDTERQPFSRNPLGAEQAGLPAVVVLRHVPAVRDGGREAEMARRRVAHDGPGEFCGPRELEVEGRKGREVERFVVALEAERRVEATEGERPLARVRWGPAHEQIVDLGRRLPAFQGRGELPEEVGLADRLEHTYRELAGAERVHTLQAVVLRRADSEPRNGDRLRFLKCDRHALRVGQLRRDPAQQSTPQCTAHVFLPKTVG